LKSKPNPPILQTPMSIFDLDYLVVGIYSFVADNISFRSNDVNDEMLMLTCGPLPFDEWYADHDTVSTSNTSLVKLTNWSHSYSRRRFRTRLTSAFHHWRRYYGRKCCQQQSYRYRLYSTLHPWGSWHSYVSACKTCSNRW
jgi:hypothetical protein